MLKPQLEGGKRREENLEVFGRCPPKLGAIPQGIQTLNHKPQTLHPKP
jgi:hypothetical protein